MKRAGLLILLFCSLPGLLAAQIGIYQHGTVVRMHMGDCVLAHHGFMVAFGGPSTAAGQEFCPEYTLVSDGVVFVIVGKSSNQLIPLAETIDFRLNRNELAVRVDDAKRETRFTIKEMIVRSDWDRMQQHIDEQLRTAESHGPER
jgi:hypothetical protein